MKRHKDPKFFQCNLCRLGHGNKSEKKTRWFYVNGTDGIVCADLDDAGHALRLLFIPSQHKPTGKETIQMRGIAAQVLRGVVHALEIESAMKLVEYDLNIESDHWYARAILDWV